MPICTNGTQGKFDLRLNTLPYLVIDADNGVIDWDAVKGPYWLQKQTKNEVEIVVRSWVYGGSKDMVIHWLATHFAANVKITK